MARKMSRRATHAPYRTLSSIYGQIPLVDSDFATQMVILPASAGRAKGNRRDFTECVLAKACRRTYGLEEGAPVSFGSSIALVALPDENGSMRVVRFQLKTSAQRIIADFDNGKDIKTGVTVTLHPPCPNKRLDAKREYDRKRRKAGWRKPKRQKATVNSTLTDNSNTKVKQKFVNTGRTKAIALGRPKEEMLRVRNGSGRLLHTKVVAE